MKIQTSALACFAIIISTTSCSKGPTGFDAKAALERTTEELSSPEIEVVDITYSEVTKTALNELEPSAGMPFRISGNATFRIASDLYKEVSFLALPNSSRVQEVQNAYDKWGIQPPAVKFPLYVQRYRKGNKHESDWSRDIEFFNNPDTGKLDYRLGRIIVDYPNGYKSLTSTKPAGLDISDERGKAEAKKKFDEFCDQRLSEIKVEAARKLSKLLNNAEVDHIVDINGELYRITFPKNFSEILEQRNVGPDMDFDEYFIEAEMEWLGTSNTMVRKLIGRVSKFSHDQEAGLAMSLRFPYNTSMRTYHGPMRQPEAFGTTSKLNALQVNISENSQLPEIAYFGRPRQVIGRTSELEDLTPPASKTVVQHNEYLELHDKLTNQTFHFSEVGRKDPVDFSVSFSQILPDPVMKVTVVNKNTGKTESFTTQNIEVDSYKSGLAVKIKVEREEEYDRDLWKYNRFYSKRIEFRFSTAGLTSSADSKQIAISNLTGEQTEDFKAEPENEAERGTSRTEGNAEPVQPEPELQTTTQSLKTFKKGNYPKDIRILPIDEVLKMPIGESPRLWTTGTFVYEKKINSTSGIFKAQSSDSVSNAINSIGSIFGKAKNTPEDKAKAIYIEFPEGFPPVGRNQAIVVASNQPLEVVSISENEIRLRSRAAD